MFPLFIFNLSGAHRKEDWPKSEFFDLSYLEGTSCYCDTPAQREISSLVKATIAPETKALCLIDSGDYHYMTSLLCGRFEEAFSLILLDNHPDMQAPAFGEILSCGGWVKNMLKKNPLLKKVLILGFDESLAEETEGFPGRVTALSRESSMETMIDSIRNWSPEGKVYISIDKDVLSRQYASTGWSQGTMTIQDIEKLVKEALGLFAERLCGMDICGALTERHGGGDLDRSLNLKADKALVRLFRSAARK